MSLHQPLSISSQVIPTVVSGEGGAEPVARLEQTLSESAGQGSEDEDASAPSGPVQRRDGEIGHPHHEQLELLGPRHCTVRFPFALEARSIRA